MKKNSYKLSTYALIILAISLVSLLAGSFLFSRDPDSSYRRILTDGRINGTLDMSLTGEDYSSNNRFNFAVKSYKLKYFDQNGNVVTDPGAIEAQKKKDDLKAKGLDPKDYLEDWMLDQAELKSEYKTFYLTNEYEKNEFDPLEIEMRDNDFLITGSVINDSIVIDKVQKTQRLMDSDYNFIDKSFKSKINDCFRDLNSKNNIKSLKFAYYTSLDDEVFKEIEMDVFRDQVQVQIGLSVLIAAVLSAILGLFMNMEKVDESQELKKVFKFPIEVVLVLFFIFSMVGLMISSGGQVYTNLYIFYVLYLAGLMIVSLTVNYFVILLKSIFNKNTENYLVKNSLIYRIFTGAISEFSNINEENKNINNAKIKFTIVYYGICFVLFIAFLFFASMFHSSLEGIIFPMILFGIFVYVIILKNINEVARISRESSEIVKGNYKKKMEKTGGLYDGLVDNFNNIGSNLDLAIEDAVKSERLKTELITNVSHDLKTPLTSILNYSDLLSKEDNSQEEAREYAKIINEKSNKLKVLIEDLFEVSKASSNNIELDRQELDFNSLVAQSIGEWEDKIKENNIEIISNLPEEKVMLNLDGQKFSRVLDNLFSNISKYALENSRVYVDLRDEGGVKLTIKNISKYPLNISAEELMERFTRGEKSRTTSGSGLGLSIASSFVRAHGASFDIDIDGDLFKVTIEF
ncbi:HAMP domain-containing sensor histidine kinase [Peptoniphilus harei]|uniref:sensor histidine kinase n=1 Tax=Peptoniphilus harei TaxID=54005 RepID=UPI00254AB8DA|nr:HAMP domain-containing sensor histidine kinase [Peptoniphilus harei]MDK7355074.1 HAMP domain-containing sensor histidine kinase [Peptoniphilus harei]MDK7370814.1 HAMP domain-containing sensor histidine kinase [Peptoniphilus harei]